MKAFKAAHVPSLVLTRLVSPGWQSLWQLSGMLHSGLPAWPTLQRETEQTYFIRSNRTLFFPPVSNLRYTWIALYMTLPKAQRLGRLRPSLLTYGSFRERRSGQFFKQTGPLALASWSGGSKRYWFLQLWCSYVKCTDRGAENAAITKTVTTLSGADWHLKCTHTRQHQDLRKPDRGEREEREDSAGPGTVAGGMARLMHEHKHVHVHNVDMACKVQHAKLQGAQSFSNKQQL